MARHRSPYISLILGLAVFGVGCGDDGVPSGTPPFTTIDSGITAPPATGGTTGGSVGGTTAGTVGGTTAGTFGGTTAGTGGTTSGTVRPGTTGGIPGGGGTDAGAPVVDAGLTGGGDGGATGGGTVDGGPVMMGKGECCPDGNCLCHGPAPTALTSAKGPFTVAKQTITTGTVHYPTNAEPPFAMVSLVGGLSNTGPEMETWGPFYASHGIVTIITTTGAFDFPEERAPKLLAALKEAASITSGPLAGKLSDRRGTSGYSMGGGGTTHATVTDPTLKTSIGLAAWEPVGAGVKTPTLLLCGDADVVAGCDHTDGSYSRIPDTTQKMKVVIAGVTHFDWFGPTDAGAGGTSGKYALAFQKVYLEGDTRWAPLLKAMTSGATVTTNIK
jgi:pimeloyl-ACP methyl ester carboxylesterase